MTNEQHLDTARKLGNLGKHNVVRRGPSHHFKQLANRIGYLQGKIAATRDSFPQRRERT